MISFSSAYSTISSSGTASKMYVPVNKSSLIYSHFDHVSGVAAKKGQQGVSISKINILNTLIDNLSSIKSGKRPTVSATTDEQLDTLIENYQTQIKQAVKAAEKKSKAVKSCQKVRTPKEFPQESVDYCMKKFVKLRILRKNQEFYKILEIFLSHPPKSHSAFAASTEGVLYG